MNYDLNGYILISELRKRMNKSSAFYLTNHVLNMHVERIGNALVINKKYLPKEYKLQGKKCFDLGGYFFISNLSRFIGKDRNYLSVLLRQTKNMKVKRIGSYTLVKLPEDFREKMLQGLNAFVISTDEDLEYAKHITSGFDHKKIGWY